MDLHLNYGFLGYFRSLVKGGRGPLVPYPQDRSLLFFLFAIVTLGLVFRLYGIDNPFLDSHAERQTQVAMVARNLSHDNFAWWCTRLDMFGPVESCHVLEFPLIQGIAALAYSVVGEHQIIGRIVALIFSICSIGFMYGVSRYFSDRIGTIIAVTVYSLAPFSVYFGRTFMAESVMMFCSLGAFYFVLKHGNAGRRLDFVFALILGAFAVLAKPTAIVILLPIAFVWIRVYGILGISRLDFWTYMIGAVLPGLLWVVYSQSSEMPYGWSMHSILLNRDGFIGHFMDSAFYARVGGSLTIGYLTPIGVILAALGLRRAWPNGSETIIFAWILACLVYLFSIPGAHSGHIYYQLPLLPLGCLLIGNGSQFLIESQRIRILFDSTQARIGLACLVSIALMGYAYMYWSLASYMYDTNSRMPYVSEVVREIRIYVHPDEWIIMNQPGASTSVITYFADRTTQKFSVAVENDPIARFERLRSQGASWFVAVDTKYASGLEDSHSDPEFWYHLEANYEPVALASGYAIFDLRK